VTAVDHRDQTGAARHGVVRSSGYGAPVDVDGFWTLVDETRAAALQDGPDEAVARQAELLADRFAHLPDGDVRAFDRHFQAARTAANRWDIWAAAYLALGGASDDAFLDFRNLLVSHGRITYLRVLDDPDNVVEMSWDEDENDFGDAEGLGYLGGEILEERGLDPEDADASDEFGEPSGEPFPEDDHHWFTSRFPRLWARYGAG
jgi:hypothetical protein